MEIYRRDTSYSLNGCTLVNNDGSFRVDFGEGLDDIDVPCLTVRQKSDLESDSLLKKSKGILWLREMALDKIDAIALFCDTNMVDYVSYGIDGDGLNGSLHGTAVATLQWSGFEDHVETGDFRRGDSLGRDADSTDTNTVDDWIHQGGPNSNGATPNSQNNSPLLVLDAQLHIIDLSIALEPIGDYLEPNDSATGSLSVCNTMEDSVSNIEVLLETDVISGIVVAKDPLVINNLASEACTCIYFNISAVNAPPRLHAIEVTLVTPDEEVFAEAQVLVIAVDFGVELETLFGRGLVGLNILSSDGLYHYKMEYDLREIQVFDETSAAPLVPLCESVVFNPVEAFLGLHLPDTAEITTTEWKRKLLFGVANFLALEVVLLRALLGTVSETGLEGILNVLKTKGWKYTFKLVLKLLGRYRGMAARHQSKLRKKHH